MGLYFHCPTDFGLQALSILPFPLANLKAFSCGWCYILGYTLDFPTKAVFFSIYMSYWWPNVPPGIWITIFFVLPILFNFFNVRRYGEIEFFLTTLKILSILGLVIIGFIIVADGTRSELRLALDSNNRTIPCVNMTGCLPNPGFKSMCLGK